MFEERAAEAIARARRRGELAALLLLDLDRLKEVNDGFGHEAGDVLLRTVAARLRGCLRGEDFVARIGGDEFCVLLQGLAEPREAAIVAQKLLEALAPPCRIGAHQASARASIGIACLPRDGEDTPALLRAADAAMYRAKEAGRNTYQLCTDDMKRRAVERLSLETRLRRAIAEGQLVLHYQPQVSLTSGAVVGVEALVRWNDPERGLVHPSAFIPMAEESRLILPLGEWVLHTACSQMRAWLDRFWSSTLTAYKVAVEKPRED